MISLAIRLNERSYWLWALAAMFACFTGAGNIAAQQQADSALIAQRVTWIRSAIKQISSMLQ